MTGTLGSLPKDMLLMYLWSNDTVPERSCAEWTDARNDHADVVLIEIRLRRMNVGSQLAS